MGAGQGARLVIYSFALMMAFIRSRPRAGVKRDPRRTLFFGRRRGDGSIIAMFYFVFAMLELLQRERL